MLLADGVIDGDQTVVWWAAAGLAVSTVLTWYLRCRVRARATALPRPRQHRSRVARREAPGVGRHDRAPRASGVPRPALDAARPRVRARPHVPVAVHDRRMAGPPGGDARAADDHRPGARATHRVRGPDGPHRDVAAGGRAERRGERRRSRPTGASLLRPRHDRAGLEGGPPLRPRSEVDRAARGGLARLVHAGGRGAHDHRTRPRRGVVRVRCRLRGGDRVRGECARRVGRLGAARRRGRQPAVAVRRRRPWARSVSCAASGSMRRGG